MKRIFLTLIFIFLISSKLLASSLDNIYSETATLRNGMNVVVVTNRKVPAITHMVIYNVGSNHDPIGKSGIAHFVEHMMFKSTANLKAGEFHKIVSENGGSLNAFTMHDYTGYYERVSVEKLPLMMKLEADRMTKLNIDITELLKEREVIIQERYMRTDNIPFALLIEQMHAALYINHPNHRPVIGWMHEMKNLNSDDVRSFYNEHYNPKNATLVVAGNITMGEIEPLAEKYYGKIKAKKSIRKTSLIESPQITARKLTLCDNRTSVESIVQMYQTPLLEPSDINRSLAIDLVTYILGGNKFSRLYKYFVKDTNLSTDVDVGHYNDIGSPGTFIITMDVKENLSLIDINNELNKQIRSLYLNGISEQELKGAKQYYIANNIYQKESFKNLAMIYAIMSTKNIPFEYFEKFSEYINNISLNEVNSIIKEIFTPNRSVTGLLFNDNKKCEE